MSCQTAPVLTLGIIVFVLSLLVEGATALRIKQHVTRAEGDLTTNDLPAEADAHAAKLPRWMLVAELVSSAGIVLGLVLIVVAAL